MGFAVKGRQELLDSSWSREKVPGALLFRGVPRDEHFLFPFFQAGLEIAQRY